MIEWKKNYSSKNEKDLGKDDSDVIKSRLNSLISKPSLAAVC
jgi:hypothetical protein